MKPNPSRLKPEVKPKGEVEKRAVRTIRLWWRGCELGFGPEARTTLLYDRSFAERLLQGVGAVVRGGAACLELAQPEHGLQGLVLRVSAERAVFEYAGQMAGVYLPAAEERLRGVLREFWEASRCDQPRGFTIFLEGDAPPVCVPFPGPEQNSAS